MAWVFQQWLTHSRDTENEAATQSMGLGLSKGQFLVFSLHWNMKKLILPSVKERNSFRIEACASTYQGKQAKGIRFVFLVSLGCSQKVLLASVWSFLCLPQFLNNDTKAYLLMKDA